MLSSQKLINILSINRREREYQTRKINESDTKINAKKSAQRTTTHTAGHAYLLGLTISGTRGGGRLRGGGGALGAWGGCILRGLDTNLIVLFGGGDHSPTPHSPKHHTSTHHSPKTHTPTHHTSTHHNPPPRTTIPRGGRVALPMKPEAAPLSPLGHSTT